MLNLRSRLKVMSLIGTVAALCLAGPASAQTYKFTLDNVTFNDGATASGSFDYNPSVSGYNALTNVDITTSTVGDGLIGSTYASPNLNVNIVGPDYGGTVFNIGTGYSTFDFATQTPITGIGTYDIIPGRGSSTSVVISGEYAEKVGFPPYVLGARSVNPGGQIIGSVLPVPEASTTVGFVLVLVAGSLVLLRKRRSSVKS